MWVSESTGLGFRFGFSGEFVSLGLLFRASPRARAGQSHVKAMSEPHESYKSFSEQSCQVPREGFEFLGVLLLWGCA